MAESKKLIQWYKKNFRDFPWRKTKNPYYIWISEIMLQQTRATAVVDYYERFLSAFPNITQLAEAPESEVLAAWSGLGYYSRARNIHKAAKTLKGKRFPRTYEELLRLPGFGPYTSRAVASFAFGQECAVLDGNVIRFISRYNAMHSQWWKTTERRSLQLKTDEWLMGKDSATVNQALMEIGATICTPQKPSCLLCPVRQGCQAKKQGIVNELPLKKTKRAREVWLLDISYFTKANKIAFSKNHALPFLKGQYLHLVSAKKLTAKPKDYLFKHSVTHHDIYIKDVKKINQTTKSLAKDLDWFLLNDIKKVSPFSLTTKVMDYAKKNL